MANPVIKLSSGTEMPLIGLGTWQSTDENSASAAMDAALEVGYRLIDTAFVYGNEAIVGGVLKKWLDTGKLKREDVFITTKLPNLGNRRADVEKFLKRSLESLGLDYVDLYLVHHPVGLQDKGDGNMLPTDPETGLALFDMDTDLVDLWKGMEEQVEAGRAKAIGVSNFNKDQVERLLKNCKIPPANNQVELHAYLQQPELVKYCQDHNVSITSYATLGSPGRVNFFKAIGITGEVSIPDVMDNPVVVDIAKKHGKTPAQVLLRFFIQKNIAVIPKSVTPERIKQNFQVTDFTLTADEITALNGLDQGPKARGFTMIDLFKGIQNHPEFPHADASA